MLELVCLPQDIACALNDFRPSYHADFAHIRQLSKSYLAQRPTQGLVDELARALRDALNNWGAGKRSAPRLKIPTQIAVALADEVLREQLINLHRGGIQTLGVNESHRIFRSALCHTELETFDLHLLAILNKLADALFIGNTNVTYPMKALLLITGFMPALDSQVRKGLTRAGMPGLRYRQLLPKNAHSAPGRRVCQLPFLLGDCWERHNTLLMEGIRASAYPQLSTEPGRVFDVLLFMQQDPQRSPLLSFRWS